MISLVNDFLKLFYPSNCAACGKSLFSQEVVICLKCQFELPVTGFHQHVDNPVAEVFWGRVELKHASSYLFFNKGGKVQQLLHLMKYKRRHDIGHYLGKQFGASLKQNHLYDDIDCLVPVPLHPKKQKKRGYNQSLLIAEGISEGIEKPVIGNNLIKKIHTESQTKKSRYERWENVREVFGVRHPELLEGRHVLLVDDVLTTGATLEACATVLMHVKEIRVSIATIAYAQA
jgi:ComF family protein